MSLILLIESILFGVRVVRNKRQRKRKQPRRTTTAVAVAAKAKTRVLAITRQVVMVVKTTTIKTTATETAIRRLRMENIGPMILRMILVNVVAVMMRKSTKKRHGPYRPYSLSSIYHF